MDGPGPEVRTDRLLLRRWREADLEPFAALNSDPEVMRFFPRLLSRELSDAMVHAFELCFEANGFGIWAVERREDGVLLGAVGLNAVQPPIPCAPAVEVGWRLARPYWRCGYASEAARASLRFGFDRVGIDAIVAFTSVHNLPSRALMLHLGMTHDPAADFDHPGVPWDSRLRRHVLYRIAPGQVTRPAGVGAAAAHLSAVADARRSGLSGAGE